MYIRLIYFGISALAGPSYWHGDGICWLIRHNNHDDDELNINPPTPCLGKRPQRPKPKEGPGRPWGQQKPLAHGRTVEGVR